ncbi:MAG: hypothetical protein O3A84_03075 [Proteobacteria bacterium]|nr:hypothetical protein [Pseudomonadota bacterium]
MEKQWFESKTLWVNGIAGLVSVSAAFGIDIGIDEQTSAALVGGIMAVVNVILRFVTKAAVTT